MRALSIAIGCFVIGCFAAGCGKSKSAPPVTQRGAEAGAGDAAAVATITPAAAKLSGVLWFVADGKLAKLAGGTLTTTFDDVGAAVFPSRWALPDGRLVGIASRGDGAAGSEQLVLIGPGSTVTRIGETATAVRDPAVDPAGAWIVYEAKLASASELYRLDLATTKTKQLTKTPQGDFKPAVLGADAIVFVSSRDGDAEVYRASIAGDKLQRLTAFHRDDWDPTPAPDARVIAFVSDREGRPRIFLMDPDGTHQRRLTSRTDADLDEVVPVWSPDGKSLAYLVEAPGASHVWLRDVANGSERLLTPAGARDADATFSPDGAAVVVSRTIDRVTELWAIAVATGEATQLTSGAHDPRLPRWLP
ncbi:MAG: PD40 domain-containing protein [Deltaproteobacteria bacterium]|nr:PD40 domain-containing protein [Deltaproteobacteria bacterium]MDQ3296654.1 hypothetical protein [Myxococcota bacterium]